MWPLPRHGTNCGYDGHGLPVDMYLPEHAARIKGDPSLRRAFGKVPITKELRARMIEAKQEAVDLLNESINLWQGLDGLVKGDIHQSVLDSLEGRRNDAIFWRVQIEMYMDYKLGRLTEMRIEELLEECRGLEGVWVKDPMATEVVSASPWPHSATPATFASRLRAELRNPRLENLWRSLPRDEYVCYGEVEPGAMAEKLDES